MKKTTVILFVGILGLTISCKEEKKEEAKPTQMQMVMDIHDEVMPKMGALGKLVGELNSKVDTTAMGLKYDEAKKDLQESHKAMMDWMQGFGTRFDSDEIMNGKALSEEKQGWLDEEETKVKALRDQINTSIENAEALLKKED